jgi:hypothetical protein
VPVMASLLADWPGHIACEQAGRDATHSPGSGRNPTELRAIAVGVTCAIFVKLIARSHALQVAIPSHPIPSQSHPIPSHPVPSPSHPKTNQQNKPPEDRPQA